MPFSVNAFVSSQCRELHEVRDGVRKFLKSMGLNPLLSDDHGFPTKTGDAPHVTCLGTLEECQFVVGIIKHRYGKRFDDWGRYAEYRGLSPTHAELRHAQKLKKTFQLFVHRSTLDALYQWRADPIAYAQWLREAGPELETLQMLDELLAQDPPPYYEDFDEAADVITGLHGKLVNIIYWSVRQDEQKARDHAGFLMDQIFGLSPELRREIEEKLDPRRVAELSALAEERDGLQARLDVRERSTREAIALIEARKDDVERRLKEAQREVEASRIALTMAAVKDSHWLQTVRSQLMPKQPGRIPFHNAAEVALRGFHNANGPREMVLDAVTWSPVDYARDGLHRGYRAALIFTGKGFAPGATFASRDVGADDEGFWRLPSIYFGDYLEVSTAEDPNEMPLSYRNTVFAVRNPAGATSGWVPFSYPFDDKRLVAVMERSATEGRELVARGDDAAAIEPLRKATAYARGLYGSKSDEQLSLQAEWNSTIDRAALKTMRYRVGSRVRVARDGAVGTVPATALRNVNPYILSLDVGGDLQVCDADLV